MIRKSGIILISLSTLAACGYHQQDRAVSGALIGAGVGATGGAITGGDPLSGALIGGALGAAAGAFTDPHQIDLGKPIWKRDHRRHDGYGRQHDYDDYDDD